MDDAEDRITAGELRAMGIPIPEVIPDCGNIPRSAIDISPDPSIKPSFGEGHSLVVPTVVRINAPFTWVEATVVATKAEKTDEGQEGE